jgi:hypothetical protein
MPIQHIVWLVIVLGVALLMDDLDHDRVVLAVVHLCHQLLHLPFHHFPIPFRTCIWVTA